MKRRIAKLIDVKSIVTLILTVAFVALCFRGELTQEFLTIYTVIISFYFGTQFQKSSEAEPEYLYNTTAIGFEDGGEENE